MVLDYAPNNADPEIPPPNARSSGVFLKGDAIWSAPSQSGPKGAARISDAQDARVFGFESDLAQNLTFIPLAIRFNLDRCCIKLSLEAWQRLPELKRRELLHMPCRSEEDLAHFRRTVRALVSEYAGEEPVSIPAGKDPPWTDDRVPDQLAKATTALGFPASSSAQWRKLSALQRFALLKLSREGREHRDLGAALREFGLL
jgi:hypothetical protein